MTFMQLIPKPELSEKIDTMQYDRHLIVADKNGQIYRITKKFDEDGLENPRSFVSSAFSLPLVWRIS